MDVSLDWFGDYTLRKLKSLQVDLLYQSNMKAMSYFQLAVVFFAGFGCSVVRSQAEQFEYECDILQRLDTLENQLKASDQTISTQHGAIVVLQNKAQESEETIALLQSKAQESEETIALLQNKTRESEETIALLQNKTQESEQTITSLTQQLREKVAVGSTYVRWGRTSCPGHGSERVYHGVAGGSWFEHRGGAAEHLCMPLEPEHRNYTEDSPQTYNGRVYGAEYQLDGRADRMKFFPDVDPSLDLVNHDVPCAVCHVSRNTMIMIPAKRTCMDGWTREYEGLLVSDYFDHPGATEYICLDDQPEVMPGGGRSHDGKVLYFVESRCGSLPCPNYVDGRELSCVVCTK